MSLPSEEELVRKVFDAEVAGYEHIDDLHDAWLFSRMHYFITKHVIAEGEFAGKSVLDVGCGTGLQSFLYASIGAVVTGIDISPESIAAASRKSGRFSVFTRDVLLYPYFNFVRRYNMCVTKLLQGQPPTPLRVPVFQLGDVGTLPFPNEIFDHVTCCGSVLSFVRDHKRALEEVYRVLKNGGTYVIEVKQSCNFDLLWALLGRLIGSSWVYGDLITEQFTSVERLLNEHMKIHYPVAADESGFMSITLFARRKLLKELTSSGLPPSRILNILSVTNLIPSKILRRTNPSVLTKVLFSTLAILEKFLPGLPGRNILLIGKKSACV